MAGDDLAATARRVIDDNRHLVLGTVEYDGRPRLSPVYYTAARYRDFYWVSSRDAQHSHNVRARPEVQLVFDSTRAPGDGEAVYVPAGHPTHGTGIDRRVTTDPDG
jgi:general stress protein 26